MLARDISGKLGSIVTMGCKRDIDVSPNVSSLPLNYDICGLYNDLVDLLLK